MTDNLQENTDLSLPEPQWLKKLWRKFTAPQVVYKTTFTTGAVLVLFYVVLSSDHHWSWAFVKELGFAYVVAAILGYSIEQFNSMRHELHEKSRQQDLQRQAEHVISLMRKEHSESAASFGRQVAKDVIEAAYSATVPEPVIRAVSQYVLHAPRRRHDYSGKVEIHRGDEVRERLQKGFVYESDGARLADSKQVVVIHTSRSSDENVSAHALDLPIPVEVIKEGPVIDGLGCLRAFKAYDPSEPDRPWVDASSTADLMGMGIDVIDTAAKLNFSYQTPRLPSRGRADVLLQYLIVQDLEDELVLMSLPPCVKATLTVIHSPSISISVSSIHSEAELALTREADWGAEEHRWTLRTALLPCQGFVLNWRPSSQK